MMIKHGAIGATVALVDPQLHRPEHGDQSECILLQTKITQHERLVQFFCAFSFFSHEKVYTLLDGDNATTVFEFPFNVDSYSCIKRCFHNLSP